MKEAVGYSTIACESQRLVEHALVLKYDKYFFVTNSHGDIAPAGNCSLGLFEHDTRILSHYALNLCGGQPSLLALQAHRSYLGQIDLAISDEQFGGSPWDPKNCIYIQRKFLLANRLLEQVTFTNYLPYSINYWVELSIASDFADIFEIRGWKRSKRGDFFMPETSTEGLIFSYQGLDGKTIHSIVKFHQIPTEVSRWGARWSFDLAPKINFELEWEIYGETTSLSRPVWTGQSFGEARKQSDDDQARWISKCTSFATTPRDFQSLLDRAVDDLNALQMWMGDEQVISAGIPWYSTVFGRDAIITSLQTLILNPAIAKNTLRYLAHYQGRKEDSFTEEEPGKIMHELRQGEMARNKEIPHVPYYGTIDATPLWLILLHETWQWTGDRQLVEDLLPNVEKALKWIEIYGDKDGDGFVEYTGSAHGKGLVNQGWKDSGDGVPFPDGTLPKPPIALVEVQGYVYDAFMRMAALFAAFGNKEWAGHLHKKASELREKILRDFWMPEFEMFALALDGTKQPIPTITSNAGHLLWSGVPDPQQARRVAEHLLNAEMYSGWGIRTLSAVHRVFNPMSYHDGSVWPHDNALIAMGLGRYGFRRSALPVLRGLHDAAACDEFQRLPELFCGISRTAGTHPVWYPVRCSPQAWSAGAFFMLLQAVLGIQPEAPRRVLHINNPVLPDFVQEITLSDLNIGNSKVCLNFERHGERTSANLVSLSGDPLQIRIELS